MNGFLYNSNNDLYYKCLTTYKITFKDGTIKYTRAKNKFNAEFNVCWFGDEDRTDDIISCVEV